MAVPILLYASEVWGIYGYNDIDIIHMKFCKLLLGVRKQTVNVAVLGELGRFPYLEFEFEFELKLKQKRLVIKIRKCIHLLYLCIESVHAFIYL